VVSTQSGHLVSVHALRGLASLWVCWFHLSRGAEHYPTWEPLRASGKFGWLGVEIFFVISGFILPYVLYKKNYTYGKFRNFLVKRLVRLEPPYLVTIILIIVLSYASTLSPLYKGAAFNVNFFQLSLHVGYLNTFFDYPWLNPVFWTLAIELQFYLILGLVFPLLMRNSSMRITVFLVFCLLAYLIPSQKFFFHFFFLFFIGYIAFEYFSRSMPSGLFCCWFVVGLAGVFYTVGSEATLAAACAVFFILFIRLDNPILNFFGTISYSLYLLHIPIGGRLVNLSSRLDLGPLGQSFAVICALSLSILAAYMLYKLVEGPSQKLASSIKYSRHS